MPDITTLIDKQDSFEIIRDKIAEILLTESAGQVVLAAAASKPNPTDWKLRVFTEAFNPFEQFLNAPKADKTPIVNVWFDNANPSEGSSNVVSRQQYVGTFNIDVFGYAESTNDPAGGHKPGDQEAVFNGNRAIRLVRNILMASQYTYLALGNKTTPSVGVGKRWISNISTFQPQINEQAVQKISGSRISLSVSYNEFSPQFEAEVLNLISTEVVRSETGEIYFTAEYDYS